jgi:hypothetical protein
MEASGSLRPQVAIVNTTQSDLSEAIDIKERTTSLALKDGGVAKVHVEVRNNSDDPMFWVRLSEVESRPVNRNGLLFLPTAALNILDAHTDGTLEGEIRIDSYGDRQARWFERSMELQIRSSVGTIHLGVIDVRVDYGILDVGEVRWNPADKQIVVDLLNVGTRDLKDVSVNIRVKGYQRLPRDEAIDIPAGGSGILSFFFEEEFGKPIGRSSLSVFASVNRGENGEGSARSWMFFDQVIKVRRDWGLSLFVMFFLATQVLVLAFYYRKKLTLRIALWPWKIFKVPLHDLDSVVSLLRAAEIDRFVFYLTRVNKEQLNKAMKLAGTTSDHNRLARLVEVIGLPYEKIEEDRIKVDLPETLPTGEAVVWFCLAGSDGDLAEDEMERHLDDLPTDGLCMILWKNIGWHSEVPNPNVMNRMVVIPTASELTQLLLSRRPVSILRKILSRPHPRGLETKGWQG